MSKVDGGTEPAGPPHRLSLPERFNQGQAIPGFLLCQGGRIQTAELDVDDGVSLVETFNVGHRHETGATITVSPEMESGYVGFTARVEIHEEPTVSKRVRAKLRCTEHGVTEHEWVGTAYRPLMRLVKAPQSISFSKNGNRWLANRSILLTNVGSSMAVASISAHEDSKVQVEPGSDFVRFIHGFVKDLIARLPSLADSYPIHRDLIEEFPGLFTFDKKTQTMERIKEIDDYLARLSEATTNDEPFGNDLDNAVSVAFAANWSIANLADHFLDAMKATAGRQVILRNPFDSVQIGPEPRTLTILLNYADMAAHRYDPISIGPIKVSATKETEVPVYKLLQFE